jgi:hypothetical protein
MLIQGQAGLPTTRQTSGNPTFPAGSLGEQLQSRMFPDYYTLLKNGYLFSAAVAAANPSAFVGGAAGTPLIGIYNPSNSGKDLVLLEAVVGIRTTGTAAGTADFNHWGAAQGTAAPTGTATAARNLYTLTAAGSVAVAMLNTANTGALASSLLRPSISLGNVTTTAGVNPGLFRDELKGEIVVSPGSYYAFASAVALTAASLDVGLIWAEVPA